MEENLNIRSSGGQYQFSGMWPIICKKQALNFFLFKASIAIPSWT
jgi:hypothetical protein